VSCANDGGWRCEPAAKPDPSRRRLTDQEAAAHIHGICFKTGPPQRVGVELEWLVRDASNPSMPAQPTRV